MSNQSGWLFGATGYHSRRITQTSNTPPPTPCGTLQELAAPRLSCSVHIWSSSALLRWVDREAPSCCKSFRLLQLTSKRNSGLNSQARSRWPTITLTRPRRWRSQHRERWTSLNNITVMYTTVLIPVGKFIGRTSTLDSELLRAPQPTLPKIRPRSWKRETARGTLQAPVADFRWRLHTTSGSLDKARHRHRSQVPARPYGDPPCSLQRASARGGASYQPRGQPQPAKFSLRHSPLSGHHQTQGRRG